MSKKKSDLSTNGGSNTESQARRDVSRQALAIARTLDRMTLLPGRYALLIDVPPNRRMPWEFELSRLDTLRRSQAGKRR